MKQRLVWNHIADSWNNFRQKPLKGLEEFSEFIKGRTLFVGCGNGRNFMMFKDVKIVGTDFSEEMIRNAIRLCEKRKIKASFAVADENLPFKDSSFDSVAMLSSLHCMAERKNAISEVYRVLRPKGLLLVSVWNRWQWRFFPRNLFTSEFYIPWKKRDRILKRYYHLYSLRELKEDFRMFKIEKAKIKDGNIFLLGRKIKN